MVFWVGSFAAESEVIFLDFLPFQTLLNKISDLFYGNFIISSKTSPQKVEKGKRKMKVVKLYNQNQKF